MADFAEIDNGKPNRLRDSVIGFFNVENELLREKRRFFNKTMELTGESQSALLSIRPNMDLEWIEGVGNHIIVYKTVVEKEEDIARQVKRNGGSYLCHYMSYNDKMDYLTVVYARFAREMGSE